jgi:hypothetical protein
MIAYQAYVIGRINLQSPDRSLNWTEIETRPNHQAGKIYLLEPFMNDHVAWDSEYYLAFAIGGYHDPTMVAILAACATWTRAAGGLLVVP